MNRLCTAQLRPCHLEMRWCLTDFNASVARPRQRLTCSTHALRRSWMVGNLSTVQTLSEDNDAFQWLANLGR